MAIKTIRIDDRLIHGQVATSWLRHVQAEQIICVSDKAVSNPVQVQVLKMAAPDLIVHVFGVEQFGNIIKSKPIKKTTFLLCESLADLDKLRSYGLKFDNVNYGGQRKREDRTTYDHDLCFTVEEEKALERMLHDGIEINYQIAAFDSPTPLKDVLEKAKSLQ